MKVLLVDFYDSFTYNIYHYLVNLAVRVDVVEDHSLDIEGVSNYDKIILSPGPGKPSNTRSLFPILEKYAHYKSIFGICLGMQGIGEFYGARMVNLEKVNHGVSKRISLCESSELFEGMPSQFNGGLYHSWAIELPSNTSLIPLAYSEDGILMAIKHPNYNVYGVQFHPESILTESGIQILSNFMEI